MRTARDVPTPLLCRNSMISRIAFCSAQPAMIRSARLGRSVLFEVTGPWGSRKAGFGRRAGNAHYALVFADSDDVTRRSVLAHPNRRPGAADCLPSRRDI